MGPGGFGLWKLYYPRSWGQDSVYLEDRLRLGQSHQLGTWSWCRCHLWLDQFDNMRPGSLLGHLEPGRHDQPRTSLHQTVSMDGLGNLRASLLMLGNKEGTSPLLVPHLG